VMGKGRADPTAPHDDDVHASDATQFAPLVRTRVR
jgi:hypothetical protein